MAALPKELSEVIALLASTPGLAELYWDSHKLLTHAIDELTPKRFTDYPDIIAGTECTAALQAAFDECGLEGRVLEGVPGIFKTNAPLLIKYNGFKLRGPSAGLCQIVADGDEYWVTPPTPSILGVACIISIAHPDILSSAVSQTLARTNSTYRIQDVEISGIHFVGPWAKAIGSIGAESLTITRCKFTNFHYEVIWPGNDYTANVNWKIVHNDFYLDNDEVDVDTFGSVIEGNCTNSLFAWNYIEGGCIGIGISGHNCTAQGNVLFKQIYCGIGISDSVGSGLGATVTANAIYIEGGRRTALIGPIASVGILISSSARNTVITGNPIYMKNVGTSESINGIACFAAQGKHIISSNPIILDMNSLALRVFGVRAEIGLAGDVTVLMSHNPVEVRNQSTGISRFAFHALANHASGTMRVKLTGNDVTGITDAGDGYSTYAQAVAGTIYGTGRGNTHSGGQMRWGSLLIGEGCTEFYNRDIDASTADGLLCGRNNMTAVVGPAVTDDISKFFVRGFSKWYDTVVKRIYDLADDTYNASVWVPGPSLRSEILISLEDLRACDANGDVANTAGGAGVLSSDTTPALEGDANETTVATWPAANVGKVKLQWTLASDFNGDEDVTVQLRVRTDNTGGGGIDAASFTIESGWDGGTLVSDTATDSAPATTEHVITATIAKADVPNTANTLTLILTPSAHANDPIQLLGGRIVHNKRVQ